MGRSSILSALLLLAVGLAGCSTDTPVGGASGSPSPVPDDGKFAVLPGSGFHADGSFDPRMTCDSKGDFSPPLVFRHVPAGTAELVLSLVDEDKTSPHGDPLIHWVEWKIDPAAPGLKEHVKPESAREALNDLGEATYHGPCPPKGQTHHYRFTLEALSKPTNLPNGTPARTVLSTVRPTVIGTSSFVATYRRT